MLPALIDLKKERELAKPVRRKKKARDDRPEMLTRRKGNWKKEGFIDSLDVGELSAGNRDCAKR